MIAQCRRSPKRRPPESKTSEDHVQLPPALTMLLNVLKISIAMLHDQDVLTAFGNMSPAGVETVLLLRVPMTRARTEVR